jgi:hypothetical protein
VPREIGNSPQGLPAKVTFRSLSLKLRDGTSEGARHRTLTGASFLACLRHELVAFIPTLVPKPPRPFKWGT